MERDILTRAKELPILLNRFELTVKLESEEGGLERIAPAPDKFFELWANPANNADPKPEQVGV